MSKRKYGPEEIVAKLRQVDVLLDQGKTVGDAASSIGVTETTYHTLDKMILNEALRGKS